MSDSGMFTLLFTGVWCLVGTVFLCVGIGMRRSFQRREERLRARTTGKVVEVVRRVSHNSEGSSVSWYPIVEFEADGHRISLECGDSDGRKQHYEGQRVEVLYDPDDPTCFRLEGKNTFRLLGNIFLAAGLGCIVIGIIAALVIHMVAARLYIQIDT